MDLSYRGTSFHGWQAQPNAHTVQAELQQALGTILQEKAELTGSGRTDTGVHALQQIAHFDTEKDLDCEKTAFRLNGLLPPAVAINRIFPVPPAAHARFDAASRKYRYHIHAKKDPFREGLSYFCPIRLDLKTIEEALDITLNWKSFRAFSKVRTDVAHFDCDIFEASFTESEEGYLFSVRANRFLRGMVRAMVGTFLEIGQGKLAPGRLREILESGDRKNAGRAVPPQGLYLAEVKYPRSVYLHGRPQGGKQ